MSPSDLCRCGHKRSSHAANEQAACQHGFRAPWQLQVCECWVFRPKRRIRLSLGGSSDTDTVMLCAMASTLF
jgi:hypothetical protein